jgi:Helix-turn-helix of DDE superfamily endonuclease
MRTRYDELKNISDDLFRRLTGVKHTTFIAMLPILDSVYKAKMSKGGRKPKLAIPDMLLLTLEYLREYRTYFHIGKSYGVSESSAFKTIRWVEDTLVKHPDFALPGKKVLKKNDMQFEVILMDATETPIERPKKSKSTFIQERKSVTQSRVSW